ncbi:hypothetical protein ACS0TY_003699 [Phlomoides rotata]
MSLTAVRRAMDDDDDVDVRAKELVQSEHISQDLSAKLLKSLPESFGNLKLLINLDLSSNRFLKLPNTVGNLCSLQRLNLETNDPEELPYTIGSCSSLLELRLDFNPIKALPEAIGKLERLEILTLHYNRVKRLPSTMGNLSSLRELDLSFNELESIPETLCSEVNLEKLNIPFKVKKLFRADQTPLEIPPREAVVQYMADYVTELDKKSEQTKKTRGSALTYALWSVLALGTRSFQTSKNLNQIKCLPICRYV